MAIQGIDHVVVLGNDLVEMVAQYEALGFTVTPGGRHTSGETHNALVCFQDGSYIELIAFIQPESAEGRRADLLAKGGGLVEFMLTSDNIEIDLHLARRAGLPYGRPVPGSRIAPGGVEVAWLDGQVTAEDSGLPHLIQDVTDRVRRVPDGPAREHANGARGMSSLVIAVGNIEFAALRYQGLLDSDAERVGATLKVFQATYAVGPHRLILRQPIDEPSLSNHLRTYGDGPYSLTLHGDTQRRFSPADTGGVRLSIARR